MINTDDPLQQRLAQFVDTATVPRAENCSTGACTGTIIGTREENQDRALIVFADYPATPEKAFVLGIVCDGIGGLPKGGEAAAVALATFASVLLRAPSRPNHERLTLAASITNDIAYRTFGGRSGSTLSAIMIAEDTILGINVGDSRIYGITHTGLLEQLSRDDTMAAALGQDADVEFYKNQLLQYIGMGDGLETTVFQKLRSDFKRILVTTDGIHGLSNAAFMDVSRVHSSDRNFISRLLSLNDALGGKDNGTAIVITPDMLTNNPMPRQGLVLNLISPFDKLEIWMRANAGARAADNMEAPYERGDQAKEQCPDDLPLKERHLPSPDIDDAAPGEKVAAAGKKRRARKRRKPKGATELPLDDPAPSLEVHVMKAQE